MTDLRSRVVEAMARTDYERVRETYPRWAKWDALREDERLPWLEGAEAALDAALDILGDEFDKEFKPGSLAESDSYAIARLLVVLRDSGKGDS